MVQIHNVHAFYGYRHCVVHCIVHTLCILTTFRQLNFTNSMDDKSILSQILVAEILKTCMYTVNTIEHSFAFF